MKFLYIDDRPGHHMKVVQLGDNADTLKALQALVDGWVEKVTAGDMDYWVNEEGLFRSDFYTNVIATTMCFMLPANARLVGPCVITGYDEDGFTRSVSESLINNVLSRDPHLYTVEEILATRTEAIA